ncbi:hypothetical protein [Micromonospora arida]|uniref:hypothetical protein n=1 Tax=Micromonospora arida TaxID=2203715 RepID=UPI0033A87A62
MDVSTLRKIESGQVVEPGYFTVLSLASALALGLGDLQDGCEPARQYRDDDPRQSPIAKLKHWPAQLGTGANPARRGVITEHQRGIGLQALAKPAYR